VGVAERDSDVRRDWIRGQQVPSDSATDTAETEEGAMMDSTMELAASVKAGRVLAKAFADAGNAILDACRLPAKALDETEAGELSTHEEFEMFARHVRAVASDMLTVAFGERCPDYDESCEVCRRWRLLDELTANPFDEDEVT